MNATCGGIAAGAGSSGLRSTTAAMQATPAANAPLLIRPTIQSQ
jgi:hypothetical protein